MNPETAMCTDSYRDTLIGYLYGELSPAEQRLFETHLKACEPCRLEVAELRGVRDDLLAWAPPECRDLPTSWIEKPVVSPAPMARVRAWMPAFGLAAAAMLVLAVSAAIANLEVRYDANGLVVRTGRAGTEQIVRVEPAVAEATPISGVVTMEDLRALEQRVLQSFDAPERRGAMQTVSVTSDNPQLSRAVQRLIEESEQRTRREMAGRFLEIAADWEGHRRADMNRVQQALNQVESRTRAQNAQQTDVLNRLMLASQNQNQAPQR